MILLRNLLVETKDGEWGKGEPFDGSVEMAVIRGTDFDTAKQSQLSGVPVRHIPIKAAGRKTLKPFDILIETAGGSKGKPTGKTTLLRPALFDRSELPITCASFARFLRIDPELADPEFVYWYLQNLYFNGVIENYQVQHTGIARFQFTKFADSIEIELPPIGDQKQIAAFFGSIDDRITLLRETNATLEAIAQALFKSWFVDFDPVRAKAEGRQPEGMDAATAALFPDSFEESELGLVPRGWRVRALYDVAEYINGAAYKAFSPNSDRRGFPIVKIAELKFGVSTQTAFSDVEMPEKYRVKAGDILFSWSGNPDTSIDTFVWSGTEAWLNQHIFKVVTGASARPFVLQMLRFMRPVFAELARNKQTTGLGHVTVSDMKSLMVVVPDGANIEPLSTALSVLQDRVFSNERQAQTLTHLRDTLLPRLISGQLRLPETESIVENAR